MKSSSGIACEDHSGSGVDERFGHHSMSSSNFSCSSLDTTMISDVLLSCTMVGIEPRSSFHFINSLTFIHFSFTVFSKTNHTMFSVCVQRKQLPALAGRRRSRLTITYASSTPSSHHERLQDGDDVSRVLVFFGIRLLLTAKNERHASPSLYLRLSSP